MAGRGSLFGGRSKAPALSITVQLDVVELVGKAAQHDKVIVEVDMPGVEEDDLTKSTPASVKLGQAKVNLLAKYDLGESSPMRTTLIRALQTEEEEDSEMLLVLSSVNAKGKTTELGTATFRLEKILATKQDVKAQQLPFYGKDKGVAATAKVSVTALAALQSLEGDARKAMAHGANAAAAEKGSALAVHVLALSFGSLDAKKQPPHAALRAELVGAPSASVAPHAAVALEKGEAELDFEARMPRTCPPCMYTHMCILM